MRHFANRHIFSLLILTLALQLGSCGGSGGGGSDSSDTGGSIASATGFTVTVGEGEITISENQSAGLMNGLTAGCTYNVYIASEPGVSPDNYSVLADGAMYEAVAFPHTISGLDSSKIYFVIVTEVCASVEVTQLDETSAEPTVDGTVITPDGGINPDDVDPAEGDVGIEIQPVIEICHNAENNYQTITISQNAWPAHEAHGDYLGSCGADGSHTLTITSGPSGSPDPVESGADVSLDVTVNDSGGHDINYAWTSTCATLGSNGTFDDATVQNPVWTAPPNDTGSQQSCTISVTVDDGAGGLNATESYSQQVDTTII